MQIPEILKAWPVAMLYPCLSSIPDTFIKKWDKETGRAMKDKSADEEKEQYDQCMLTSYVTFK